LQHANGRFTPEIFWNPETNSDLPLPFVKAMIEGQEWLNVLVEDCKAILVETEFNGRYDTIKKYHQVGERIVSDNDFQKYGKGNAKLIKRIANQSLDFCF